MALSVKKVTVPSNIFISHCSSSLPLSRTVHKSLFLLQFVKKHNTKSTNFFRISFNPLLHNFFSSEFLHSSSLNSTQIRFCTTQIRNNTTQHKYVSIIIQLSQNSSDEHKSRTRNRCGEIEEEVPNIPALFQSCS